MSHLHTGRRRRLGGLQALLLVPFVVVGTLTGCGDPPSTLVQIEANDAMMAEAIEQGKATLGDFWAVHANPTKGESDFAVKVAIAEGDRKEYFWLVDPKRQGKRVSAAIGNEPEIVKHVTLGQVIEFDESEIVDWMFMREKKMHGNHTARALLKRMSPEQAEAVQRLLAED
jgi:uncharacterized protein YegJ (DUF2314 family)